ncbi:DNA-3-methyladenine glycosylase family protein [Fibrivirga algicola]|uniref:DNA-3-methyladenine glycosylase II n=1 Tax=Fibrivirga algicola TaxID=2950420 RepID=A0ABX0QID5_9BACT|nr:DNA-3-methyladenine glycosylase 2 family protein [Fibrivirga algicola]NID12189.1 DNA-3-methyladenine glycosylase 2 family protein [Fibrivirga algicola]
MTTNALAHLQTDPVLAQIIAETPIIKPAVSFADVPEADRLYLALLESIVSQQISVKAADAIFRRFRMLFSETADAEGYPSPAQLLLKTTDELRAAGLSFQKIKYLQSVAEFALANPLTVAHVANMTDEAVVQYLLPIKGVGRWTVEMLLMFVLDRPDVFPVDDLVIRQKMIRAYGLTETGKPLYRRLQEIAVPWQPYRTLACRYLWRWKPVVTVS